VREHKQCVDCGKCRVTENEDWCLACDYHSCERGPDCADTANPYRSQP
jgi:hypothetical protein